MSDGRQTAWGRLVLVGAGVSCIVGVGAAFGLDLVPKIATKQEVMKLAGDVKKLKIQVWQGRLESDELKIYRLQESQRRLKKAKEPTEAVDGQIRILKRRTRRARIIIDDAAKE